VILSDNCRRSSLHPRRWIKPLLTSPLTMREAVGKDEPRKSATTDKLAHGSRSTRKRVRNCGSDNPLRCRRILPRINQFTAGTALSTVRAHRSVEPQLVADGNSCMV
jgi:hypothetical protein